MKLTDEKILEIAPDRFDSHGYAYFDSEDLVNFARAILKEAGVEELERDAERRVYEMNIKYARHLDLCQKVGIEPDTYEQFVSYLNEHVDLQLNKVHSNDQGTQTSSRLQKD